MTYTAISAGEVDADSPLDATLMGKVKDNFADHETRIATGEAGGFPVGTAATAGNNLETLNPWAGKKTSGGTYTALTTSTHPLTIKVARAGTYRVKFLAKHDGGGSGVGYAKLYKNGTTAVGTERALTTSYVYYSEDITLAAGDTIEVWAYVTSGGTTVDAYEFGTYVASPVVGGSTY